jgi:protein BCP1
MGKKRSREDGQGDVAMADPAVDKREDDDSSDDEVGAVHHQGSEVPD